jgi:hypothetical protein
MNALTGYANTASREVAFDNAVDVMIDQGRGWRFGLADGRAGRHYGRTGEAEDRTIAVQRLLDGLCDELGFCIPPRERARLLQSPPTDPDEFTDAVFAAQGLDPRLLPHLRSQVNALVQNGLSPAAR